MVESLGMDMCDSQSPEYLYIYTTRTYIYICLDMYFSIALLLIC
jgi:hypothetical protein